MTDDIPADLVKYSESPVFTQNTIPASLQRDHQTKPGVWGRIVVSHGSLSYKRKGRVAETVSVGDRATIYPCELHSVAPLGEVRFRVEFLRSAAAKQNEGSKCI